jgi:uncharacterized membrane protein
MSHNDDRGRPPDHPRAEPEIIPPEHGGQSDSRSKIWVWVADQDGMRRTAVTPPGPLSILIILALFALIVAVVVAVFLGAVLIWIPVLVVLFGAALLAATVRRRWQQFHHWLMRR